MNEYIHSLLAVGAVAVIASFLLPTENEKLRRTIELGLALVTLAILCRPLSSLGELRLQWEELSFSELGDITEEAEEETLARMEAGVAEGIAQDLARRYGFPASSVTAIPTLTLEGGELLISSLTLRFSGEALAADLLAVRDYAQKNYTNGKEVCIDGRG